MLIAFAAGPLIDLLGPCHPIVAPVPVANPMTSCTYGDPGCGAAADAEAPRLLDLSDPPCAATAWLDELERNVPA